MKKNNMALIKKLKKLVLIPQVFQTGRKKEEMIIDYLKEWNPHLKEDAMGNLYLFKKGAPLICAHMDTVQTEAERVKVLDWNVYVWPGIYTKRNKEVEWDIMMADFQIAADDKCWVAIAMELYEKTNGWVSLLFTVQEESWMWWARYFCNSPITKWYLEEVPYCLIADRRNGEDLLGFQHMYCSKEFETKALETFGRFWYKSARWLSCDANVLYTHLNCLNLSCGYYEPHSSDDYIVLSEFQNCFNAMLSFVTSFKERMEPYKHYTAPKTNNVLPAQSSFWFTQGWATDGTYEEFKVQEIRIVSRDKRWNQYVIWTMNNYWVLKLTCDALIQEWSWEEKRLLKWDYYIEKEFKDYGYAL